MKYPQKRTVIIAITLVILIVLASCNSLDRKERIPKFRFIVIGNTSPASPFSGHPEKFPFVIKSINRANPVFVVHTGNIIQGGYDYMGINENDIKRQYRYFARQKDLFHVILYTMAGDRDLFNGSVEFYRQYARNNLNYSFNYGKAHFIIFNILNSKYEPTKDQIKWLTRDLKRYRNSSAIFIFTHYPVMAPRHSGIHYKYAETLHNIFKKYPVKAVISGGTKKFYDIEKDDIQYLIAGCFGFNYEDWHWGFNQYYIAEVNGNDLQFSGHRVKFPPNSYRPKLIIKDEKDEKKTH